MAYHLTIPCISRASTPSIRHGAGTPRRRADQRGYTLLQLMVAISIVGILSTMGVSSFRYVTNSARVSGEINDLLGDMQYARAEAIKEGQTVSICASSNGTACNSATGGSTSWATGWVVWSDLNGNQVLDANEKPFIRHNRPSFTGTDTLTAPVAAVTFNRNGSTTGLVGPTTFTLHTTPTGTSWTRCIYLTLAGKTITELSGVNGCT